MSPVHALPSYYFKIQFIIILSSMPRSSFEFPPSEPPVYFYRKLFFLIGMLATSTSNPIHLEKRTKSKALIVYNESLFLGFCFQIKNVVKTSKSKAEAQRMRITWPIGTKGISCNCIFSLRKETNPVPEIELYFLLLLLIWDKGQSWWGKWHYTWTLLIISEDRWCTMLGSSGLGPRYMCCERSSSNCCYMHRLAGYLNISGLWKNW